MDRYRISCLKLLVQCSFSCGQISQLWAEGEVVKTSSWILFRAPLFSSLPPFLGWVLTQPCKNYVQFPVSIWMNLRCQKKHETVIWGNVTDEIFSGNPSSQDRDAMPTVHHHLKTHLWRDTSTWTQVRGGLSVLSSNFGAPQKLCLSSRLGWNSAAPAATRGVILGRQLILGEPSYRSAIAAWNVKCLPDGDT